MDRRLVSLADGAAMDGQAIDAMTGEHIQQARKLRRILIADAGLHREAPWDGGAQALQQPMHFIRLAQQSSAGILAADDGCGAAKIEIDARHWQLREQLRGLHQTRQITADHLGENGFPGAVFRDRAENIRMRNRIGMDPEILGHKPIRRATPGDDPHEWQVRDILHRRKHKRRTVIGKQVSHRDRVILASGIRLTIRDFEVYLGEVK